MKNKSSIQLVPTSVAVGLQEDVIQYYNELKFNLLFFENPIALLSTYCFDTINEEFIDLVKKGKKLPDNVFGGPSNLMNYKIIATEEWSELMNYCEVFNFRLYDDDEQIPEGTKLNTISDKLNHEIQNSESKTKIGEKFIVEGKELVWDEEQDIIAKGMLKMQMDRLESVLDHCYEKEVSMIWSNETDSLICQTYLTKLIQENETKVFKEPSNVKLRQILGDRLLQEVLNFQILNISAVPTEKIIEFKSKNNDLLNNFLTFYREYLSVLQSDPKKYFEITQKYSQTIAQKLNDINNEVLISKNTKKYKWINSISEEAYDSAKKASPIGTWAVLSNPYTIAIALGIKLVNLGYKAMGAEISEDEKMKKFILNSSAGYLWKARETFK